VARGLLLRLVVVFWASGRIWVVPFVFRLVFVGFMGCRLALGDIRMSGEGKYFTFLSLFWIKGEFWLIDIVLARIL